MPGLRFGYKQGTPAKPLPALELEYFSTISGGVVRQLEFDRGWEALVRRRPQLMYGTSDERYVQRLSVHVATEQVQVQVQVHVGTVTGHAVSERGVSDAGTGYVQCLVLFMSYLVTYTNNEVLNNIKATTIEYQ